MSLYSIDRFEGGLAVLLCGGRELAVKRELLPEDAAEGDLFRLEDGRYVHLPEQTRQRRREASLRLKKLTKDR